MCICIAHSVLKEVRSLTNYHPPSSLTLCPMQAAAAVSFDLLNGPLVHCTMACVAKSGLVHLLMLNMHHAVTDGWSMQLLASELVEAYQALTSRGIQGQGQGQEAEAEAEVERALPHLPIHYLDYAVWQRELLADEGWRQEQVSFNKGGVISM